MNASEKAMKYIYSGIESKSPANTHFRDSPFLQKWLKDCQHILKKHSLDMRSNYRSTRTLLFGDDEGEGGAEKKGYSYGEGMWNVTYHKNDFFIRE